MKIFDMIFSCRYTRNLIDTGNGKYNLIALCWGEGHGSSIHDHANSHCFMKILQGELQEIRFAWPKSNNNDEELQETGRRILPLNDVAYMNGKWFFIFPFIIIKHIRFSDSLGLHRVENPSNVERAVSLHLYCPPFDQCKIFNKTTGQSSIAKVTFWSVNGERKTQEVAMPDDN